MAAKKENLKNTMAAALSGLEEITPAAEPAEPEKPKRRRKSQIEREPLPKGKKRIRRKKDPELVKSHNLTLLLTESLYQRFKATAQYQGLSMNGIACRLIKKYVVDHDIEFEDLRV